MTDIELVIKIPEEEYNKGQLIRYFGCYSKKLDSVIYNGKPLPKGHGRLIDADAVLVEPFGNTYKDIDIAETIIEADKEYEVEVVTRGNCIICGKELTEGLFFCKECEDKASSRK